MLFLKGAQVGVSLRVEVGVRKATLVSANGPSNPLSKLLIASMLAFNLLWSTFTAFFMGLGLTLGFSP